jgi:carbon-monoxide dehydrogenase large subunit
VRFVGSSVPRVEDRRILTGRGTYVDDIVLPHMVHAAFVRSPMAHGRIDAIDTTAAEAMPGVLAVLTGADLAEVTGDLIPSGGWPPFGLLATDKVRLVGDPVVMVVAEDRYLAEDACELVEVDITLLPAVADIDDALDPSKPAVFDELGGNVVATVEPTAFGDVDAAFAAADRVVRATLRQHRVAHVPMETRGGVADFDPASDELTYHAACQSPHALRGQLASVLGHPMERVRVVAKDVGGSFGLKASMMREYFCIAAASRKLRRPVKWIEDRNEHLGASGQAREETIDAEVAVAADGTLLGLKADLVLDAGAYPSVPVGATVFADLIRMWLPGPYRWRGYQVGSTVVTTNKGTYTAYRGPWEMETWVRERLLDIVADELDMDPAELRRRNMVDGAPDDRLITGMPLAEVTSRASLDQALEAIGYESFRAEQAAARADGRYLGIGFATFIEAAPGPAATRTRGGEVGAERGRIALLSDGHVQYTTAQMPHGQGHETTLAQLVADELGVPFDHVKVVTGDTRVTPYSRIGTGGSRAAAWGSGAAIVTTRKLRDQVLAVAGEVLEVAPADLEVVDGSVVPRGVPSRAIPLSDVARHWLHNPTKLPEGVDPGLEAIGVFAGAETSGSGWSGGTHACTVEVDVATGEVRFLRYVVVEDCGQVINPAVVDGQVRGGVAQGIGEVLYEHAAYDRDANFLAGTFVDYLLPTSAEIPEIEIIHMESIPSDGIDIRGVGEGGAIVAPATLTNAIEDALRPLGVQVRDQYLPPHRIVELLDSAAPAAGGAAAPEHR